MNNWHGLAPAAGLPAAGHAGAWPLSTAPQITSPASGGGSRGCPQNSRRTRGTAEPPQNFFMQGL